MADRVGLLPAGLYFPRALGLFDNGLLDEKLIVSREQAICWRALCKYLKQNWMTN